MNFFKYIKAKVFIFTKQDKHLNIGIFVTISVICQSCYNTVSPVTAITVETDKIDVKSKPIEDWYILGTLSEKDDSILSETILGTDIDFQDIENPDTLNGYWYNGPYKPIYNLLDLSEIFNLDSDQKRHEIENKVTYMACDIVSDKEADMYMQVKKQMKCYQRLNGNLLHRKEIQGQNFYPIHLNKGTNRYIVRSVARNNDYSFESTIYDSTSVAKIFVNSQSNNIILPEINPDSMMIYLTNDHQNVLSLPVSLVIRDVKGQKVFETKLNKDQLKYSVTGLKENHSYMCTMTIAGQTVNQPIVCGHFDNIFKELEKDIHKSPISHALHEELEQVMYRLDFLLKHETRQSDWWWKFKIAPLTYQIEHSLSDMKSDVKIKTANNVQFKTYISELDGGIQRYLLVTPNNVRKDKKYPLVVVVRPEVVNHHHFFTSPQFTHQWAINIAQELANSHGFIIMMPEARMYHSEDLTPFANAELKLAIADIKKTYRIDDQKMYLHGICSGGYRAMHMATENPGMFAAIGLYAPTYFPKKGSVWEQSHCVETNLHKLAGTPIMIFADPNDKHNPYTRYAALIDGCKQQNIPLTFIQKINTELLYNCVLVGKEVFDFYDGKKVRSCQNAIYNNTDSIKAVATLYAKPFVYVYNSDNTSIAYKHAVENIRKEYEDYFFSEMPLVKDTDVDEKILLSKNIFLIGDEFKNSELKDIVDNIKTAHIGLFDAAHTSLSIHTNPRYTNRDIVIFHLSNNNDSFFKYPWINGTEDKYIIEE